MSILPDALTSVHDRASLFEFLRDQLAWEVDPEDTFTYDGPALNGSVAQHVEVSRIVPFSSDDPWAIMLVEFKTGFRRGDMREILRCISQDVRKRAAYEAHRPDEFIFVCAEQDYAGVRFAHFAQRNGNQPNLSVFGWKKADTAVHTLCDYNLPQLRYPDDRADEGVWRRQWSSAFDVEAVTKRFFEEYRRIFEAMDAGIHGNVANMQLFKQLLLNRLMFVLFLSKKGWLRFDGCTDYLDALWQKRDQRENFYAAHLNPLFFAALNNPQARDLNRNNPVLYGRVGDVPYLNGGLFEETADDRAGVVVDDEVCKEIIEGLFRRFNFTVDESTPTDVEVAVDPEMLGKVFEELVTDRHDSGSYYTPRPVVAFMCREALKGYLAPAGAASEAEVELVASLVDGGDVQSITSQNARELIDKLKVVRVVDPACGSGAYLVGMLHELYDLMAKLEVRADPLSAHDGYRRKLHIIQHSLYGVDIQEFAVQTARLRLWLSLIVEYDRGVPPPLPSLDFKIEKGDSLLAPNPQGGVDLGLFRDEMIDEYEKAKAAFANPRHPGRREALRTKIRDLRSEIAQAVHTGGTLDAEAFDWRVEFAEVFGNSGGFDIVVANPPYVRQEKLKDIKPVLKRTFGDLYCGTADLYCYFYARGLELLKTGGMLVFISSNKWFRAAYGARLRKHVAEGCTVMGITDFGELPVFQSAATFPMIFVARKDGTADGATVFTQVRSLEPPYPDVRALVERDGQRLPSDAVHGANWSLMDAVSADRLRKMERAGIPLGEYVKGQIYRGVLTGFNEAFVIDGAKRAELIARDPRSAEIIRPLAVGKDIRRWHIQERDRWLIFTRRGINIDSYPAIEAHLALWRQKLEPKRRDQPPTNGADGNRDGRKPGNYKWYEIQDDVAYYEAFDKPKIVFPDIAKASRFACSTAGTYINNTTYFMPIADCYLLGILNSSPTWHYFEERLAVLGDVGKGGRLRFFRQFVEHIPIPDASLADRAGIVALVQRCIDARGVGCEAWEREIDERVAALYGL